MIQFDRVTRIFGRKVAVADLTVTIPAGELFAFLGPNGAGKTTTIKMLVGLLRPTGGTVRVCDFDTTTQTREAAQWMGYVPDQPYLYDKLSGREFLEFVAEMRGLSRPQSAAAIERESERFHLDDFLADLTETYSHGMKQRLVFASALLHRPAVLVVDEPMVGLDPKSMRMVKDLLRALATAGTTVFMSTHTLNVAEEIADRIGIVDQGRLRFLGSLEELKAQRRRIAATAPSSNHDGGDSLEQLFLDVTSGNGDGKAEVPAASPSPRGESP